MSAPTDPRSRAAAAAARLLVRRIALALPGVTEGKGRFSFAVKNGGKEKGIAWSWLERIHPKKARIPNEDVLAVRVADQLEKEVLLAADEEKFFTEPHYNGYPAVLVRLAYVNEAELRKLITDAWECQAPKQLRGEGARKKGKATAKGKKATATATVKEKGKKATATKVAATKVAATKVVSARPKQPAQRKAAAATKPTRAAQAAARAKRT